MSTLDGRIVGARLPRTSVLSGKCALTSVQTHHLTVLRLLWLHWVVLVFAAGQRREQRVQKSGGSSLESWWEGGTAQ